MRIGKGQKNLIGIILNIFITTSDSSMIKKILIQNYKIFDHFEMNLNDNLNIIVGNNEAGKSTILEAVNLALTKRLNGKLIEYELTPYLFNKKCNTDYLQSIRRGKPKPLPKVIIELYLDEREELASLRGRMNSKEEDSIGVKLEIEFDDDNKDAYENLLKNPNDIQLIPSEYYKVNWYGFDNNPITLRRLPIRHSYIDATSIRLQSGTDYYLQDIIKTHLDTKEQVELNVAYRKLKEAFSQQDSIKGINSKLINTKGAITDKDLSISIDVSQKSNWETNLIPHLDDLPFQFIGDGEQNALKIMLALERKADKSNIILIEEPENHLSFSSMNTLITKVKEKCQDKQIIITTHSAYVLNKLGLENLILLYNNNTTTLKNLPEETKKYFKILPGYDTLRLVLARKAILIEGPSDELILQKAYKIKHKRLPIEDGIDTISVRGLSFARFLDIAKDLNKKVVVVTDNDGDYKQKVDKKYEPYTKSFNNIKICRSENNNASTLEPQLISCNKLENLNKILNKSCRDEASLKEYMTKNKTECALKIFETNENIIFPDYINDAIE